MNSAIANFLICNGGVGTVAIQVYKPIQASGTGSTNIDLDATSSAGTGDINITAKGDVDITSNGAGGAVDITALSNVNITATGDNLTMTAGSAVLIEATGTNASIELKPETTGGDLILTGANLESGSAGGNTGQHLRIKLNGTYYKIKLEADT